MINKDEIMQIEDLKEAQTFPDIKGTMTCNEMSEASSLGHNAEPAAHVTNGELDDFKFEGINLEDDIEKVELSSPESSDLSEDGLPQHFEEFRKNSQFLMDQPQVAGQELRNWLIKIKEMQDTICKKMQMEQQSNAILPAPNKNTGTVSTSSNPNRVMNYQDLPYMGEITLNNSKPRRGRKPKKADICHLIYKNYGTILPGTPNANNYLEQSKKTLLDKEVTMKKNFQNRYVSSLLEKRLTQQTSEKVCPKKSTGKRNLIEPMNLCVRDLDQLKIKLTKNSDDTYSTHIKSEPQSENECDVNNENNNSLNHEYGVPQFLLKDNTTNSNHSPTHGKSSDTPPFGFWSNENNLMNQLGLQEQVMYYQGLSAMNNLSVHNPRPPPDIIPIDSKSREGGKVIVKIKPKESKTSEDSSKSSVVKTKRNVSNVSGKSPAKRKRSAIFIPPISTENNANPATEVSICKFKFTGGAKPKLQEKKMLSVDSGGNFRYYSGTGDKSMRGYEFFPRETLQQTANATQGSSTGAFLQASGEKIFPLNDLNETQVKSEFLLSPELPTTSTSTSNQELSLRHKKRKSRKSIQREKLEQTFREKGFLIQTQQLQSAEGATYCKFRQLRKFTRYLFRSWKDYLPGNVREIQENGRTEHECENSTNISTETP